MDNCELSEFIISVFQLDTSKFGGYDPVQLISLIAGLYYQSEAELNAIKKYGLPQPLIIPKDSAIFDDC